MSKISKEMIQIANLHKAFGKNKVLKGINLGFEKPGITAVLGPNGSGKTTLIKCILGMVIPDKGDILFQGKSIEGKWTYRDSIDYLPQIARFPENLTVRELLNMVKDIRNRNTNDEHLLQLFELKEYMDKRLGNLSGGTRQKVNLVLTFMYDSPLIILDEPTAGLDPVALIRLKELIQAEKAKGKIILITTHIMSLVEEVADELVFLLEGNIHFKGSPNHLKRTCQESNLERTIAKILQQKEPPTQFSANGHRALSMETFESGNF